MREILYRAWDKEKKKYFEILLLHHNETGIFACTLSDGRQDIPAFKDGIILEQYTGLKDATKWKELTEQERESWINSGKMPSDWDGKKIFEGDIVKFSDGKTYLIVFMWGEFALKIKTKYTYDTLAIKNHYAVCKVIGNKHQNLELLERSKA